MPSASDETATKGDLETDEPKTVRVLSICSHVIQYGVVMFREIARQPRLDLQVAFCSMQGAEPGVDPEFGVQFAWDVPLLDGYSWVEVPNLARRPGPGRFFGLVNPGIWKMIREGRYDAVVISTGYQYASFWIALAAAKASRTPFVFATDVVALDSDPGSPWKVWLKRRFWPLFFRSMDAVLVASTGSHDLIRSLGVPEERITITPSSVDNEWWQAESRKVDRAAVRATWGLPADARVALFCGKLVSGKRPSDLLKAVAAAHLDEIFVVMAGEGPLRGEIEREAASLGIAERVRILGFVNQSGLPAVYAAADVLVLPSDYDAFGLVVNEAMSCGRPAVISDRVGAKHDLVREGETGFVYPCGDVAALGDALKRVLRSESELQRLGEAARHRMRNWSPKEYAESFARAIESLCAMQKPA